MTTAVSISFLGSSGSLLPHEETLAAANINPRTGLATDYLNHFNEAIMLLDIIPDMPDCAEDFLSWQPLSYAEHFRQSNFKARDLAIAAYDAAPSEARHQFDALCEMLTSILIAVRDAMMETRVDGTRQRLAAQATDWLKPLIIRAGVIVNGGGGRARDDTAPQADIDLIMSA
jgi:hypothetical protein